MEITESGQSDGGLPIYPPLNGGKTQSRLKFNVLYGFLILNILFIFLYRLNVYPAPWHDEGDYLTVARNFAFAGIYGDSSSEGYRFSGPVVSAGPTVILPVAAIYRVIGGVDVTLARLVIVAYGIVAIAALYLLAANLYNRRLALVAVVLMVFSDTVDFQVNTRNVMGEVPGLALTLLGLVIWLRAGQRRLPTLIVVGVLLGLASITKNQYAVIILPSLLLCWILEIVWYRQPRWRYFVVPGLVAGLIFFAWTYYTYFLLGADMRSVSEDLEATRTAIGGTYFVFDLELNIENFVYLIEAYSGLVIPSLLLGLLLAWRRDREGQVWGILLILTLAGSALYVFSVGWPRGVVAPLAIASILVARLLYGLTDGFHPDWDSLVKFVKNESKELPITAFVSLIVLGLLISSLAFPIVHRYYNTLVQGSYDPYATAEYLNANVPKDAVVETWEEELAALTDHNYHYPPLILEAYRLEEMTGHPTVTKDFYDFRDYVDPDYVINGPFSRPVDVYGPERLANYALITSIGAYDIYQKRAQ